MSLENNKQFLTQVLDEIEIHKLLYKSVEISSVLAKRKRDLITREGKWHNFFTIIKMLHFENYNSWEKKIEKKNFVILSAIISMDQFQEILTPLVTEQILNMDEYKAHGPFTFNQMEFLQSDQSKFKYNIDWPLNVCRITGKENLGLPSKRRLNLELETVPFGDALDAIRYYTKISPRSGELQNNIHIITPLYYAKIKEVSLSDKKIFVKIKCNASNAKDLEIKYNTEGHEEDSNYYEIKESNTIQPIGDTITINLEQEAEKVTLWLYHKKGFIIDQQTTRKIPTIEVIEEQLSRETPYLHEGNHVITNEILQRSELAISELITTEQGIDSIDVEILKAIKTHGGEYERFIPNLQKYLSFNTILSRLARLRSLGFIRLQPPKKILLTSLAIDVINLPPSVLIAKVPHDVGLRLSEIQLAFRNEDYDKVTNNTTKLLESILKKKLENKYPNTLHNVWPNLKLRAYNRASLGNLWEACLKLKIFKKNGLEDHLLSSMLKIRVPMSHEKRETTTPSNIALVMIRLLEAFTRVWYYY